MVLFVCLFLLLQFAVPFSISLCFVWKTYDESTGLEPNLVFGSHIAAIPVLQEPSRGDNYQLHLLPLL